MDESRTDTDAAGGEDRRAFLKSAGRYAATVPPVMTVLLSTSLASPAIAQSTGNGPPRGSQANNGVGNGSDDGQPSGNAPINDGPGTGPGNPGNRGGTPGRGPDD